jgi:hypothetical protein
MQGKVPIGKQTGLAIAGTAGGLTLPTSNVKAQGAIVQNTGGAIRFWVDGSTPTASEGHRLADGGVVVLDSYAECANFKAIRETSTSGALDVTYFI